MRKGLTQKTLPGFNGILNTTITMWIKKKKATEFERLYNLSQGSNNVISQTIQSFVEYLQKNFAREYKTD